MVHIPHTVREEFTREPNLSPEQIAETNPRLLDALLSGAGLGSRGRLAGLEVEHDDALLRVNVVRLNKFGVSIGVNFVDDPDKEQSSYDVNRTGEGIRITQLLPLTEKSDTPENQHLMYDIFTTSVNTIRFQREMEKSQRGGRIARLLGRNRESL